MRFISEDPIGWASGQTNNYAYVGGNPISLEDPLGLGSKYPTADSAGIAAVCGVEPASTASGLEMGGVDYAKCRRHIQYREGCLYGYSS